jgi:ribonuclease HI
MLCSGVPFLKPGVPFLTPDEWLTRVNLKEQVSIHVEGVCKSPIEGPGAWCVVFLQDNAACHQTGSSESTTKDRMDLVGASEALLFLPEGSRVHFFTASMVLYNGIFTWIKLWRENGWLTKARTPVKNQDLWKRVDALSETRVVEWSRPVKNKTKRLIGLAKEIAFRKIPGARHAAEKVPRRADGSEKVPLAEFLDRIDAVRLICVYCDGTTTRSPGPGGWGAVILQDAIQTEISGGERDTTKNRMDIKAAIEALAVIPNGASVVVTTDNEYVKNGITYVAEWMENGWKTAENKKVFHKELWIELHNLVSRHDVIWEWVQGHKAHPLNKRAHALANMCVPEDDGGGEEDAEHAEEEEEKPKNGANRDGEKEKAVT